MNTPVATRKKAVSSALGSLRAEGMKPNKQTQKILKQYTSGHITANELRVEAIKLSKNLAK